MRSIILILTVHCIYQSASLQTLTKSLYYPHNHLIFDHTDELLAYAYCSKNRPGDRVDCTVVREKYPYQNDSYTCNVTLKAEKPENILGSVIKLKAFGKDKAVILWSEVSEPWIDKARYVKVSTVQFSSCKISETKLPIGKIHGDPFSTVTIVDYNARFDVFFEYNDFRGDKKKWKVSLDADGRVIGEIFATAIENLGVKRRSGDLLFPIDKLLPEKGLFSLEFQNHKFFYSILHPDGTRTTFASYKTDTASAGISTAYATIGVCYAIDSSRVNCTQHDLSGKLKFETTLHEFSSIRRIEAVHNVATGGLLFLARQCEGPKCNNIVVKVDSSGKNVGRLSVGKYGCGLSWGYDQQGIFYENENNEFCASVACYGTLGRNGLRHAGRLKLFAKCFSNDDFKSGVIRK